MIHPDTSGPDTSVAAALTTLNRVLQGPDRRCGDAHPLPSLRNHAQATRDALTANEIARMVRAPWRIARAVYPWLPAHWPVANKTASDVMADCRTYIDRERARAGHWSHDLNRLIALRQAEAALARLIQGSGRSRSRG